MENNEKIMVSVSGGIEIPLKEIPDWKWGDEEYVDPKMLEIIVSWIQARMATGDLDLRLEIDAIDEIKPNPTEEKDSSANGE